MKRKVWALLMAGILGAVTLAGCGDSNAGENNGAAEASEEASEETEVPEDTVAEETENSDENGEIYVFIAASLANAMDEIAAQYKDTFPGLTINYNADSSGTLQTQIEEGAECDVFFSAAAKQMDALKDGGLVDEASVKDLLVNKVVLIKPAGGETAVTGFENITDAANIALAGEDVPVGQYAREIFQNMGIMEQVNAMEINEGKNVTEVLAAVSEGSNEVGVVYATDAASVGDSVEIIAEASDEYLETPVIYPAGLVKNAEADEAQSKMASDFLEYLTTEPALDVFENYGFTINQ